MGHLNKVGKKGVLVGRPSCVLFPLPICRICAMDKKGKALLFYPSGRGWKGCLGVGGERN